MKTIERAEMSVNTPGRSYPILLGSGLLGEIGALAVQQGLGRLVVVASDTNVAPLYAEKVLTSLQQAGFEPHLAAMQAGEDHKNWGSVAAFVGAFIEAGLDRSGWVMALGGGVVGDTAGFAASVYMRGVSLVQVPTTLLSMADSSIGGKVGVDHLAGKNLLGAFKQPDLVVIDLDTLGTLPPLQIACGMAEIIKAGIIGDPQLFALIERSDPDELDYQEAVLRAVMVKKEIVERDPYEAGERALLNLGHTFGHALESYTAYERPHGVAVAQGMALAFRLARKLGMCDTADEERLLGVLAKWGLQARWGEPDLLSDKAAARVYSAMLLDKKRRDGRLRLVLPEEIGKVRLVDSVCAEDVLAVLAEMQ